MLQGALPTEEQLLSILYYISYWTEVLQWEELRGTNDDWFNICECDPKPGSMSSGLTKGPLRDIGESGLSCCW